MRLNSVCSYLVSENISDQLVLIQNPDPVVAFLWAHLLQNVALNLGL